MEASVGCDWLINELGPPPDAILRIPPPPVPHFMDHEFIAEMAQAVLGLTEQASNDSSLCHWCHWARRIESAGTISGTSGTEMALEDTWFFVILASCLMLTLGALLSGLVYLRLNGKSFKGAWDFGNFLSDTNGSILMSPTGGVHPPTSSTPSNGSVPANPTTPSTGCSVNKPGQQVRRCSNGSNEVYHHHSTNPAAYPPAGMVASRALWAGVKTCSEGNHYTITHAQPFEQKRCSSVVIQQSDEDSAGYTTLHPPAETTDNQIYYCCTDLITQPVTSLDDPPVSNPLYVNMSAVHHIHPPQRTHPPINPIYPSSCGHFSSPLHRLPANPSLHVHPHRLYTHQA